MTPGPMLVLSRKPIPEYYDQRIVVTLSRYEWLTLLSVLIDAREQMGLLAPEPLVRVIDAIDGVCG